MVNQINQIIPVIFTNKAACRDCYRCVRACPVNAISVINGQAQVIASRCIACGTCVNECPQGAKSYRSDLEKLDDMIKAQDRIAFSIAPSFAALYSPWEQKRLPSALRALGAVYVGETAIGAYESAQAIAEFVTKNPDKQHICPACPAVVSLIEKYYPALVKTITPVVSPMVAHGRMLKKMLGAEVRVVFVGPCTAKKDEASRMEHQSMIDVVLTFDELQQLFIDHKIDLRNCEESDFNAHPHGYARYFPVEGGLLKTAGIAVSCDSDQVVAVSGEKNVRQALETLLQTKKPMVVEPMFCNGGCVHGPVGLKNNSFLNRGAVIEYSRSNPGIEIEELTQDVSFHQQFNQKGSIKITEYTEDQIMEVLTKTGKESTENQLNCGACGYNSCRDKAIAVLDGMAELEMCIPYMRRLAEQKSDLILETDPNGIVILDDKLQIVAMNPAFRKMFFCTDAVLDKKISYLIDPDPFEKLLLNPTEVVRKTVTYKSYNLMCHQMHYHIKESNQLVGIFVDITDTFMTREKLKEVKRDTLLQARELIDHQVEMAQEIARYLGESSAQGEMLLKKLMSAIDDK
ncbi:MAG: [Fe-Fe] hydrogenase large subunit C-terminal domain-containing protein [Bacteroidales bacterium]|jgi:iron only hydrogenase large subunit-like protein